VDFYTRRLHQLRTLPAHFQSRPQVWQNKAVMESIVHVSDVVKLYM